MLTLRSLAIAMAATGVFAGLSARSAQACDNDRYPCPVVAQPQETDAPVRSPQSRKNASRAAPQDEKARAKAERQSSQAQSQTNPAAQEQAANALRGKDEVSSRRSTRKSGATKTQPQQPLPSFVPMPPAPARKVRRVNRMHSVTIPSRPSRRVG